MPLDERTARIYEDILGGEYPILDSRLLQSPLLTELQSRVRQTMEKAAEDHGVTTRSDSRMALFVNVLAMVALPLQIRDFPNDFLSASLSEALAQDIEADVYLIVAAAAESRRDTNVVASDAVYTSIASRWKDLKTVQRHWD